MRIHSSSKLAERKRQTFLFQKKYANLNSLAFAFLEVNRKRTCVESRITNKVSFPSLPSAHS